MQSHAWATPTLARRHFVQSRSAWSLRSLRSSIFTLSALLLVTSAHAQSPVVDGAWEGVWELDFRETECESGVVTADYMGVEHLCAGQSPRLSGVAGFPEFTCVGTVTDTTIDVECTGSREAFPGCSLVYGYGLHGVRIGENVSGFETYSWEDVGPTCVGVGAECYVADFTGFRVPDRDPDCLTTPLDTSTWSAIKGFYR